MSEYNQQPLASISVVTPTLGRPEEVRELLENLSAQRHLPAEIVIVDGAPTGMRETEYVVRSMMDRLPFRCVYIRRGGGTAIQRNIGIDAADSEFIAFIDDDIRLEPDFFEVALAEFAADTNASVGGIAGYIVNQFLDPEQSRRWRWYRRLRLFTTYEPGRFDFGSGYPINRYLQAPHDGAKQIDFMGAGCAVWRSAVFADGLRFAPFFADYGVMEDAHLALRAGRRWVLLECGRARCIHLRSLSARPDKRRIARKTAVNYRYLFIDIVRTRPLSSEFRFWRLQMVDLARYVLAAIRSRQRDDLLAVLGKVEGIIAAARLRVPATT